MLALHLLDAPLSVFFDLHGGQALLLIGDLVLHAILLLDLEMLELLFLFILLLDYLGLLGLLPLRLEDSLLNLALLVSSLLVQRVIVLGHHALVLVLHLVVIDFLHTIRGSVRVTAVEKLTFYILSSLRFFKVKISFVRFLVSSIFFQVFCSSCLRRAIRLARSWASLSML